MFLKLVVLCTVAVSAFGAPPTNVVPLEKQQPTVIPIVSQSEELDSNGTYKFSYETGNGIKREEISYDKVVPNVKSRSASSNEGGEDSSSDESNEIHVQQGSYSYTAPDGTLISLRYIADENGFRPVGDHIPRVAAPVLAASSSSEKSGRALTSDSAAGASSPAAAVADKKIAKSVTATDSAVPSLPSDTNTQKSSNLATESNTATESSKTEEPTVGTTVLVSSEPTSTASPADVTTAASTSGSEASTSTESVSSEVSTPVAVDSSSTESASTTSPEQSTTASPEAQTTEVPSA